MKKIIVLLAVAVLAAGLVFAAASTRYTKYLNIIKSGEFVIRGTVKIQGEEEQSSQTAPFVLAAHAGGMYMESMEDGAVVKVLVMDGKYHMIDESSKSILSMSMTEDSETDLDIFPSTAPDIVSSGNGKLDDKSLFYEKYFDAEGLEITLWYNGNNLYALQNLGTTMYVETFEQKSDPSLFKLPEGYEVMDLDLLSALFAGGDDSWGSTDTSTGWSSETDSPDDFDWSSLFGDTDWSDSDWSWEDSTWQNEPNYYALAIMFGLTEEQAYNFNDAMGTMRYLDWYMMNGHYNDDTGKYENLTVKDLDLADYEIEQINQLMSSFKK